MILWPGAVLCNLKMIPEGVLCYLKIIPEGVLGKMTLKGVLLKVVKKKSFMILEGVLCEVVEKSCC